MMTHDYPIKLRTRINMEMNVDYYSNVVGEMVSSSKRERVVCPKISIRFV